MMGVMIVAATAALGIDYGWQPVAGGGIEYIIQIEPEMLESLRSGEDIFSDMPPAHEVRSWRITVGTDRLPHEGEPPPQSKPAVAPALPADFDRARTPLPGPDLNPQREADDDRPRTTRPIRAGIRAPKNLAGSVRDQDPEDAFPEDDDEQTAASRRKPRGTTARGAGRRPIDAEAESEPDSETDPDAKVERPSAVAEPERPWVPLSVALLGLFASLGGNAYLLWVTAGLRHHYRSMLRQSALATNQLASSLADDAERARWDNS